ARAAAEQAQREEQARAAAEQAQREEQARAAAEQAQREEQARAAAEQAKKEEQARSTPGPMPSPTRISSSIAARQSMMNIPMGGLQPGGRSPARPRQASPTEDNESATIGHASTESIPPAR
ncbi:MAG: hypothetical protein ACHQUC_05495, partial [Chlamydiales bacterium]